jgi:hypothetical protein
MASIRIGFFEDFKGADTLLLDVDREGLHSLIAWLQTAASSDRRTPISSCPGCIVQAGLAVDLLRAVDDTGPGQSRRASDLWVQASLDYEQRLQELFFPEGIA